MAASPLLRGFLVSGTILFTVALLYFGARVLVPVVEALIVCFVLNALAGGIRRLPGIGPRVPRALALAGAAVIAFGFGAWLVGNSVRALSAMGPQVADYETALGPLLDRAAARFGLTGADLIEQLVGVLGIEAVLRTVVAATAATINHFGIVAIYAAFMLVDQQFFDRKLRAMVPDPARRERTRQLLAQVVEGIAAYLRIMTLVSFLTAVLSYAVLRAAGVDYAGFWATMIFFLNFIPTIGSILGTVVPAGFALLQFQELFPALVVLAGIGAVQFVMGNLLLPRIAGGALNISLAVTIFSLFFWGALWGVTGMFVAMPLTAMMVIGFGQIEATRPIAILLSRTGALDVSGDPQARD